MEKKSVTIIAFVILFSSNLFAQDPTIGLLYNSGSATDGYVLFTPENSTSTYLINNCGEVVNEWGFSEKPGLTCYLLEDGNILRAGKDSLEIRDWDNNLIWYYPTTDNGILQHHDIEPLPNGNILVIATERVTSDAALELGRDPALIDGVVKLDMILEMEPVGTNEANIVWEWKFSEHYIQDYDETKPNYGVVADHPERLNLNIDNGQPVDYTHFNSVDYNAELNQILVSCRHFSEILIIDHSTTSEEVSGHTGGNYNMGGDIIYRWGNSQLYGQGDETNKMLNEQHDAKWVPDGYMDEGKISIFNNGEGEVTAITYLVLIEPEVIGGVYQKNEGKYLPVDYDWSWHGDILGEPLSDKLKGACHTLPNGNFMVTEYNMSRVSELAKDGTLIWSYVNPVGDDIYAQYETTTTSNGFFRGEKYLSDYAGFNGKDLSPQGIIENENTVSVVCASTGIEYSQANQFHLLRNTLITDGKLLFNDFQKLENIKIYSYDGTLVQKFKPINESEVYVNLNAGIYIIEALKENQRFVEKFVITK